MMHYYHNDDNLSKTQDIDDNLDRFVIYHLHKLINNDMI